jgi:serine/threonine protein kinase
MSHNIKRIAAYRIVRVLGEGGMGTVYEAQHESISRRVAIKVLKPEFAKDKDLLKRFFNEARAANEINHPGVIKIWDADTLEDGTAYLVMELLEGQTLAQYLAAHPGHLEMNVLLDLAEQLTQTMLAAHSRMIIHRDLKPDNIMLLSEPGNGTKLRLKILDFGIAKLTQALGGGNTHAECMGTPTYCPPEQIQNAGSVDEKADVYSLGCILYECASGAPPFEAVSVMEMMAKQLFVKPRRLTELTAHIGMDLADLVDQMLSKQPTERPNMEQIRATILEVKETLRRKDADARCELSARQSRSDPSARSVVDGFSPQLTARDSDFQRADCGDGRQGGSQVAEAASARRW